MAVDPAIPTMESNKLSTKRKRTESLNNTQSPLSQPKRVDSLWFDDGSVVLQAETTQFRVHRSVLSANSDIFRDMFSMPQPTEEGEVIDGCPVVHLPDSADDWAFVLQGLYDSRKCYTDDEQQPFALVAAFLRLGTKYEIPHLRSEAVERLIRDYPLTLETWSDYGTHDNIILEPGRHFSVANLAREVGLVSILPVALYYACEMYSFMDILDGVHGDDGQHVILSTENQKACLRGRERLIVAQHNKTFKWMDVTDPTLFPDCRSIEKCNRARMAVFYKTFRGKTVCYALATWSSDDGDGFCSPCVESSRTMLDAGRAEIWNELPSVFDLSTWEELVKE